MPKSIDDIIPPSRRRMMDAAAANNPPPAPTPAPSEIPPYQPSSSTNPFPSSNHVPNTSNMPPRPPQRVVIQTGRSFPYGTAIIALLVIALSAGALYIFSGAKVEVTPNTQTAAVSGDFTATSSGGDLPYQVITSTKSVSTSVPAESTETANDTAQGSIVVSNTQSTAQTLINNTRFQTPDGLVYHIHAPITVPAASANGTPGTLTVTVYGDKPGVQYNIGPSTFTVPGLQGSDAYMKVTAKSAGQIAGGFTGTRASVSADTDARAQSTLQSSLGSVLTADLSSKIPAGYVLLGGATFTSYQPLPDTATTSSTVLVNEQGTAAAVVFPKDALAKAIAYKVAGTYSGEPVTLSDVSKLHLNPSVQPASTTLTTDLQGTGSFTFSLAGSTTVIWKIDTAKIAGAVAGKTRDSAQQILSGFPEVDKAVLILRPFWTNTFPQDPAHIQVTVATSTQK